MSNYFRERPLLGMNFRGKSRDELMQELKQQLKEQFDEKRPFFESAGSTGGTTGNGPSARVPRDPFERHMSFPRGFPFDDEGGWRRGDIRSHLDDLAARHPEFADHLLGPPWADVPFAGGATGSLHRNRNRRASGDRPANSAFHNHPDEDARSQTSAGSTGSGSSSHGDSEHVEPPPQQYQQPKPQGLRNNHTLDIGQHQHNMENPQQQRNVRSMSAPPENNRNNQNEAPGQPRFVSRVDITPQTQQQTTNQSQQPQMQQPTAQSQQREKSPAPQQKPQTQSQQPQGNVRHIPIFVEGRDEPVLAKDTVGGGGTNTTSAPRDEPDFPRRQQSPPHFQRPSHYQQHFNKQPPSSWMRFEDPFFEHSTGRWPPPPPPSPFSQFRNAPQQEKPRPHHPEPNTQNQRQKPQQQSHTQQNQQPHSEPQPEAPPKPRQQIQPKDPLERVALVQKEVDALTEQVKQYTGNSRQDKQYMYLDEMLTRELIKLDDIETEGKENVRQARKQAIKSIQESISLLESKAPLPGQQSEAQPEEKTEPMERNGSEEKPAEAMDIAEAPALEEQKAIPLPPPTSPTKAAPESQPENIAKSEPEQQQQQQQQPFPPQEQEQQPSEANVVQNGAPTSQTATAKAESEIASEANKVSPQEPSKTVEEAKSGAEPTDSSNTPAAPLAELERMEVRQSSPAKEQQPSVELQPVENKDAAATGPKVEADDKPKKEPPPVPAKPGKSPKKAKKSPKKPQQQPEPVSEAAIPMPAPDK